MERKTERKWRTLRSVASQIPAPEKEAEPAHLPEPPAESPEPVAEEAVQEEAVSEAAVERPLEDTSKIRLSPAPWLKIEDPDPAVSEDVDGTETEISLPLEAVPGEDAVVEPVSGNGEESEISPSVFEELEGAESFFATAISMGPEPASESVPEPPEEGRDAGNRILVVHGVTSTSRLIRETLENFTEAEVDTTSDPVRAFELALQKPFRRFFFAMQVGELSGAMLYELISKAYANGRAQRSLAPGVVFIREKSDPQLPPELARDARVKDSISKPIRIDRLLKSVEDIFEVRDPTVK